MTDQQRPLKGAWGMTALLLLFMLINFADKVVVGLAAQPIMAELKLSPEQFGLLGSSFFFLFAISGVVVGFITNRVQTRHTLLVMAILWSVVEFPMLGTVTLEMLIACRIILGAGEGPAAPVALHSIYKWFPDPLRGVQTAIIAQGSEAGGQGMAGDRLERSGEHAVSTPWPRPLTQPQVEVRSEVDLPRPAHQRLGSDQSNPPTSQ